MSDVPNDEPLSAVEKVKEESRGLRGDLAAELAADSDHFSDAGAQLLKFHGTYHEEDRDQRRERRGTDAEPAHQLMVRCKIPGGLLSGAQYLAMDELADRYCNGTLRVTTRQGNQFHGVLKGDLKATIHAVNDVLVTTLGACGDVVRNVFSCPAPVSGGLRDQVLSVARSVSDHLLPRTRAYHEIWLDGEKVAGGAPEPEPIYGARYLPRLGLRSHHSLTGTTAPPPRRAEVMSPTSTASPGATVLLPFFWAKPADRLTGEAVGEIEETEDNVLVIRRIHVRLHLRAPTEQRLTAERVQGMFATFCPV